MLGLRPALGRWFTPAEDALNAPPVAVLGYRAWTTRFASDPAVIGRIIRIEGVPVTIVGVGPANHAASMSFGVHTDFWLPIGTLVALGAPPAMFQRDVAEGGFFVKAHLRPGVTVAQARAAMATLGARLAREFPKPDKRAGISVYASRDVRIHPQVDTIAKGLATAVLAIVGLVLAIACSNLATLLLVRGAARVKEVSVRLAVGATRAQLVRHLLTESVLLALAGGAAGCVLAWWTMRWLTTLDLPVDGGLQPRPPRARLRAGALVRHRHRLRPGAGAAVDARRAVADAARRRRGARERSALVQPEKRAGRVPGGRVRVPAGGHRPGAADGGRGPRAAGWLRGGYGGDARDRPPVCG